MVHNLEKVLDEGIIKSISNVNMTAKYIHEFIDNCCKLDKLSYDITYYSGEDVCTGIPRMKQEELDRMIAKYNDLYDPFYDKYMYKTNLHKILGNENPEIAKFMGAIPFYPSVMINISPNWKGKFGKNELTDKIMINGFRSVIDSYLNETVDGKRRYSRYKYCLECGSEGNFLHAHIVAEINPIMLKSMKTHINKGNHKQQLMKYWDKLEKFKGFQGCLKGKYSVQRILINSTEIFNDKLKYLHEENKEEGHSNMKDLQLVFGNL